MMPHDFREELMKLSDTQLMILSSASQRADHCAILPQSLKGGAASRVVDRLLKEKLLQEVRASGDMPVWHRGEDNRQFSLQITKPGLKLIEVDDMVPAPGSSAAADATEAAPADVSTKSKRSVPAARVKRSGGTKTSGVRRKATKGSAKQGKSETKQGRILALLQRPKGASLDALVKETQWQKHSVRGFLAGTVRKKLKLPLLSEKTDGIRTYRIGRVKGVKASKKRRSA
jgi:hypothetical protein